MRVDIWDVAASKEPEPIDAGLPRDFPDLFTLGKTLGKGGFGLVRCARTEEEAWPFHVGTWLGRAAGPAQCVRGRHCLHGALSP